MSPFVSDAKAIIHDFRTLHKADPILHETIDLTEIGLLKHDIKAMNDVSCYHKLKRIHIALKTLKPIDDLDLFAIDALNARLVTLLERHHIYQRRVIHDHQHGAKCMINMIQLLQRPSLSAHQLAQLEQICEEMMKFGTHMQQKKALNLLRMHVNIHPNMKHVLAQLRQHITQT